MGRPKPIRAVLTSTASRERLTAQRPVRATGCSVGLSPAYPDPLYEFSSATGSANGVPPVVLAWSDVKLATGGCSAGGCSDRAGSPTTNAVPRSDATAAAEPA